MTRVSKKNELNEQKEQQLLDRFFGSLSSIGNWQEAEAFFWEFFTREELKMLAKRMELYKQVLLGHRYKVIIDELGVTSQTVCDARKKMKRADVYFLRILRKFLHFDKRGE